MSVMWRCLNGHSGPLDKPGYGGPPTLPTRCPTCGASTAHVPLQSLDDNDRTLAPELASNAAAELTLTINAPSDSLSVLGNTVHLDDSAPLPNTTLDATLQENEPSDPVDPTNFTLNLGDSVAGGGEPDGTLNLSSDAASSGELDATLDLSSRPSPVDQTVTLDAADSPDGPLHQTVVLHGALRTGGPQDAEPPASEQGQTLDIHAGVLLPEANRRAPNKKAASIDQTVAFDGDSKDASGDTMAPDKAGIALPPPVHEQPKSKSRVLPGVAGYELISELGRGGMGVVYKARQLSLNRLVALKMVLAANRASAKDLVRFQIEAEAVAQLVHPNIVQIYQIGEREGCPYFSLEFVPGGTLADRTDMKPQPATRAARLVRALAMAMDFAHRRGIVHRDLKPANILLALPEDMPPPDFGQPFPLDGCIPKITDFGLAKRLEGDGGHTHDGAIMGTPNYMAPEQARGQNKGVGPAADIYALGSILYDLLTGMPPFRGSTIMETLQWVVSRDPVPPRKLNALVPSDLSTICLKCLEKDPAKRYATAGDLAEDLRRYLEGEPILARRNSWLERTVKWARRRPTAAALVAICILTVLSMSIGGVAFAVYYQHKAVAENQLREVAVEQRDLAEKNRLAAQANFLEACKAVDDMLLQVGSERLAAEPRMEKVRRELLDKAAKFYAKHLQDTGPDSLLAVGDDPNVRWRAARSSYQLGRIEQLLGQTKQAEEHYRRAAQLLNDLHGQFPSDKQYRRDLANTHNDLGVLYTDQRKFDKAENEHRQAQTLRRQLTEQDPTNVADQYELAASTFNIGQVERQRGDLPQAKEALTAALEQTQHLPNAAAPAARQQLARVWNALGQTLQDMGQEADAKKAFEQAGDTLRELARSDREKTEPEYRRELAVTFSNLGQLQRDTNPPAAETAYNESLKLSQGLVDDFPSTPIYRQDLAGLLNNLAVLLQAKGEGKQAEILYVRAIQEKRRLVDELPLHPDYRRDLVAALNNRGLQLMSAGRLPEALQMYDEAVPMIRALLKDHPDAANYQEELGNSLSNESPLQLARGKLDEANKLAEEALRVHKDLADRFKDDRPEYRYDYGRALANYGGLLELENKFSEAKTEYLAAIDTLKPLVEQNPDVPDYKHQLALTYGNLADMLSRANQPADAWSLWEKAHQLLGELAERYRGVPVYRKDLARSYNENGRRLALDGKFRDAIAVWEKARAQQQELVEKFNSVAEYRIELARTLANLASALTTLNQLDEAGKLFRQSVAVLEDYQVHNASNPQFRGTLLTNAKYRANFLRKVAVSDKEAIDAQTHLIRLRQQEVDASPDNVEQLGLLAMEQYQLALLYFNANVNRDARIWLEKAVENQRTVAAKLPNEAKPRAELRLFIDQLMLVYARLDEHALVARSSAELVKLFDAEPLARAEMAARLAGNIAAVDRDKNLSGVARVVLRLMYAEQAMRFLQDAAQRGFKDAASIKGTPAFTPLHQRADYQELLRKMEMGTR